MDVKRKIREIDNEILQFDYRVIESKRAFYFELCSEIAEKIHMKENDKNSVEDELYDLNKVYGYLSKKYFNIYKDHNKKYYENIKKLNREALEKNND